jgi:hypothetical protein
MKGFSSDDIANGNVLAPRWQAKLAGGILLWIAVASAWLLGWMAWKLSELHRPIALGAIFFMCAIAIIGTFCLTVGWRLFLNRPNQYGSILGPNGWRALGTIFGLFAVAAFAFDVLNLFAPKPGAEEMMVTISTGVVSTAIFSVWCLLTARRITMRRKAE